MANYVEAIGLLASGGRAAGITARNVLTKNEFTIRARLVVNASGPWVTRLASAFTGRPAVSTAPLSKAFNLLIKRQLIPTHAIAAYSRAGFRDRAAIIDKGSRMLFITRWQKRSLIGTAHFPYDGDPEHFVISASEIEEFLDEINRAYPEAQLTFDDIERVYAGLLPVEDAAGVQLLRHHRLEVHQGTGLEGLISVTGVKFTEARFVAEQTVNIAFQILGNRQPPSRSASTPLYGGDLEDLEAFVDTESVKLRSDVDPAQCQALIATYGSAYREVLQLHCQDTENGARIDLSKAQVLYAVRKEMAQKLSDVIFRRTEFGLNGHLNRDFLRFCAATMALELHWSEERAYKEVAEIERMLAGNSPPCGVQAA